MSGTGNTRIRWGLPRPRRAGVGLLLIATLLYLAGSNIGSGWVVMIATTLVALVVGDLVALRAACSTAVSMSPGTSQPTTDVPLPLTLGIRRRNSGITLLLVLRGADVEPARRIVVRAAHTQVDTTVPLRRGRHPLTLTVKAGGPLGLATRPASPAAVGLSVVVEPEAPTAWVLARDRGVVGDDPAPAGSAQRHGDMVDGIRPFLAGDRVRDVHWRSTARHGEVLVRERRSGRSSAAVVASLAPGIWSREAMDLAAIAAAGLLRTAEQMGFGAVLRADGREIVGATAARRALAELPPAAGVPARPLVAPPPPAGEARRELAMRLSVIAGSGCLQVDGRDVGTTLEEVRGWLAGD